MATTPRPRVGWIVDVQNDFMRPEGRLYVKHLEREDDPGAQEVLDAIVRAVRWMEEACDVLVYTGDWHGYEDAEIDLLSPDPTAGTYPPHCMGRSDDADEREGALIVEPVRPAAPVVLDLDADAARADEAVRLALEEDRPVMVRKNRFDVFEGNPATDALVEALAERLGAKPEFVVVGVARDVCVAGAVDGLQARGQRVTVVRDATWGLGIEDEAESLERWSRTGSITTVDELSSGATEGEAEA